MLVFVRKTDLEKNDVKPTVGFNFSPTLWDDGGVKNKNNNISLAVTEDRGREPGGFNHKGVCTRVLADGHYLEGKWGGFNHKERRDHIDRREREMGTEPFSGNRREGEGLLVCGHEKARVGTERHEKARNFERILLCVLAAWCLRTATKLTATPGRRGVQGTGALPQARPVWDSVRDWPELSQIVPDCPGVFLCAFFPRCPGLQGLHPCPCGRPLFGNGGVCTRVFPHGALQGHGRGGFNHIERRDHKDRRERG
ncbi:MAG: hypothetical protein JWR26_2652 [Pedosphaera sp.]|nr:hypothetical protein [Pedosphaera sp.]